jgi:hypothetical protein
VASRGRVVRPGTVRTTVSRTLARFPEPVPLPWQFWAGAGVFGSVFAYLLSKYDRESGRYSAESADNQV